MTIADSLLETADKAMVAGRKILSLMHDAGRACNYNPLMVCRACGHKAREAQIENGAAYHKCVSNGFNLHGPGDGEPPEWETVCRECGAEEPFVLATVCAECDDYPCTCD